jgi:SOS-response transcriptional repressor LexA
MSRNRSSFKQREILDFIRGYYDRLGVSPTLEEIGEGVHLRSIATVHKHVTNLMRAGKLTRDRGVQRSIRLKNVCPSCGRRLRRKVAA